MARVATDPDRVLDVMEPGDVLVAPWTAPTYNAVLAIAGAVVVQEGGLLCHAAVMARELEIPAVIGCRGAMTLIGDGDLIDVDAGSGEVRVVRGPCRSGTAQRGSRCVGGSTCSTRRSSHRDGGISRGEGFLPPFGS